MLIVVYVIVYVFVFAIGAVIGSFLNVLIYRLPLGLDYVKGFSFCPACKHRLYPLDLVPIFSYLFLKRKCRYCGEPISPRYMTNEIIGGALACASWTAFMPPFGFLADTLPAGGALLLPIPNAEVILPLASTAIYFVVLCCLLTLAWIDHDTMEIPDRFHVIIAALGALAIFFGPDIGLKSHLIGIGVASVPLFIIMIVLLFARGVEAFGFGDIKLMAAAGFFLGWQHTLVALFLGIIIGGAYGVYLLATRKKGGQEHFAFGPALCAGIGIAMFAADPILNWYLGFL
ncbi:MAG: prepilin peptidase [Clostridiales Family XIII bacterium]|jgi:leader peptidase (prepilin peptidase)/N-methyltransferase|nr:prepilin peptidase [Clostridiales Family XIII bacterium]